MEDKIQKIQNSIEKLNNKEQKILFFITESHFPSGAISEVYKTAKVLRDNGYNAMIMTENKDYQLPTYIEDEYLTVPHLQSTETINVTLEDFLIIPEIFTNVMEQSKSLPCTKIVLLQNFNALTKSIPLGVDLSYFNIYNVITTSENLKDLFTKFFGPYDTQICKLGIPDYFKESKNPKKLKVTLVARNSNDAERFIKLFYVQHPEFKFITFENAYGEGNMGVKREELAKKLGESACTLWLDRTSSFGTLPLEAMKSGSVVIGLIPEIESEYMVDYSALWTNDFYQLPDLLSEFIKMFIQDAIPEVITNKMIEVSSQYSEQSGKDNIVNTYEYFFNKRIKELTDFVQQSNI